MKAYVIDASVAVKWYIPEAYSEKALKYLDMYTHNQATLLAPDLIIAEVGNVLLKKIKTSELTFEEAEEIAAVFTNHCPVRITAGKDLMPAALKLADTTGLSVYDCLYLALAIATDTSLVTADEELKKLTARHRSSEHVTLLQHTSTNEQQ